MKRKAFTLIELLVVIAIIALLLSILMPALSRVKNQAKVTLDAANMKQIGTVMKLYETDYNDKLPILFNRYTVGFSARARFSFLSVALRDYVQWKAPIEQIQLNIDGFWGPPAILEYTQTCVPDFLICPFVRGNDREGAMVDVPDVVVKGPGGELEFDMWEKQGYNESYDTWLWPAWVTAGGLPLPHPYSSPGDPNPQDGRPKYENVNWYNAQYCFDHFNGPPMGANMKYAKNISLSAEYNSVSDKTLLFCSQGEWLVSTHASDKRLFNYQSHRKGKYGGTNTIFGDTHVEWVRGSQIGWP